MKKTFLILTLLLLLVGEIYIARQERLLESRVNGLENGNADIISSMIEMVQFIESKIGNR